MRLYGIHDEKDQFGGPMPTIDVMYRKKWMTYKVGERRREEIRGREEGGKEEEEEEMGL